MHRVSFGSNKSLCVDGQIQTSQVRLIRTDLPFSSAEPDISPLWSNAFKKQRGERAKIAPDCLAALFLYVCSFYGSVNGNPIAGKAFNPNSVTLVDSGIHCIHCCLFVLFVLGLNHGRWGVCECTVRKIYIWNYSQPKQSLTGDFKEQNIIIHAVKYWEAGEICKRVLTQYLPFLHTTYIARCLAV